MTPMMKAAAATHEEQGCKAATPSCQDCRFWESTRAKPRRDEDDGECRRRAPVAVVLSPGEDWQGARHAAFPLTWCMAWCGEFEGVLGWDWTDERWAAAIDIWRESRRWDARLGPPPGQPGCRAPAHIAITSAAAAEGRA